MRTSLVAVVLTASASLAPLAALSDAQCLVPESRILSGGVARDGIPALTSPRLASAADADGFLDPWDLVLGVEINGEARAYPLVVMWWHEIVNDVLGGKPVVVSYCPLTGSGLVFDAAIDEASPGVANFGVSGLLFDNNLILFDRDTETLWLQMHEQAICGPRIGDQLTLLPVLEMRWEAWKAMHPETSVVSFDTGHERSYGRYPYADYDLPNDETILFPQDWIDRRLPIKEVVLGIRHDGVARAYSPSVLADVEPRLAINDDVNGLSVLVVFDRDQQLMIPFERVLAGEDAPLTLTFEIAGSPDEFPFALRDVETGSRWNLEGAALEGPLEGARLEPVVTYAAMWFAWSNVYRFSEIYEPPTSE